MAVTRSDSVTTVVNSDVTVNIIDDNQRDYGDPVNSNFVMLAENFAHTSAPANPSIGQLWFNKTTTDRKIQVFGFAEGDNTPGSTATWQKLVQQNDNVDFRTLDVAGDVTLGGSSSPTISISGTTSITGVTTFDGSTTFNVDDDRERVKIAGSSEFDGSVAITANGTGERVSVTGPTTITGNTNIDGNLSIDTGHTTSLGGDTTITGNLTLSGNDSNLIVDGDASIAGDLTVSGTMTTVNANQVDLGDNILVLNAGKTNAPASSDRAGIEFERGTSNNVQFRWNESSDKLEVGQVTYSRSGRQGSISDVANSFSNVLLESDTSTTAVANRIPKYNSGAKLVGDITGEANTVAGISGHGIENLSNVVDTNRSTTNKWLKWGGSNYAPAALVADDIPYLSASKINADEFDAARIPNLNADKINDGELAVDRIPTIPSSKVTAGYSNNIILVDGSSTNFNNDPNLGSYNLYASIKLPANYTDYIWLVLDLFHAGVNRVNIVPIYILSNAQVYGKDDSRGRRIGALNMDGETNLVWDRTTRTISDKTSGTRIFSTLSRLIR